MRQHRLPGGDKSPPPGSLRGWAVEDVGKFGLRLQSQVSGKVGTGAGHAGKGGPCVDQIESSQETWVPV